MGFFKAELIAQEERDARVRDAAMRMLFLLKELVRECEDDPSILDGDALLLRDIKAVISEAEGI